MNLRVLAAVGVCIHLLVHVLGCPVPITIGCRIHPFTHSDPTLNIDTFIQITTALAQNEQHLHVQVKNALDVVEHQQEQSKHPRHQALLSISNNSPFVLSLEHMNFVRNGSKLALFPARVIHPGEASVFAVFVSYEATVDHSNVRTKILGGAMYRINKLESQRELSPKG